MIGNLINDTPKISSEILEVLKTTEDINVAITLCEVLGRHLVGSEKF